MMIDFADEFGEGVAWNFTMGRTPEGHLIAYGHRGHFVAINAENGIYTSGHQEGLFNDLLQDFKLGQIRRESVKVSVP